MFPKGALLIGTINTKEVLMNLEHQLVMIVGGVAAFIFVVYLVFALYSKLYQKVGPNEVLVVSGRGGFRLIQGGGSLVFPFVEKAERFSLEMITIDITTPEVFTHQGVPLLVDAVAQVKVGNDEEMIKTCINRFLSKSINQIHDVLKQTLEGHTRAIIGKMNVEDIIRERDKFASQVFETSLPDLQKMGFIVDSFQVRDIKDNQGYLASLGKPETARVKSVAAIAEAQRSRDAQMAAALATQESEIAKLDAKTKIAEKDRDYRMQVADYNMASKQKEAEADLAYDLQQRITQQKIKEQEIQISVVEKVKNIEVQEKEAERREKELLATVRKPAEAKQFEIQTLASAEQFKLKATADGQAEATKVTGYAAADVVRAQGLAEAEAAKAKGLAEAEVNRAKGLADADVILARGSSEANAMTKKAEAWKGYNEAAIAQMVIDKLPEITRAVSEPLSKTDKIVMITSDGSGASKLTKDVTNSVAQIPTIIEALTGLRLEDMIKKIPSLTEKK